MFFRFFIFRLIPLPLPLIAFAAILAIGTIGLENQGLCSEQNSETHNEKNRLPNIVIIFIDDQGYGDIGPFGAKGYTTPNLDRMAAEGCKYTNFHVPQPVCSASRAGLLTG